MAGPGGGVAEGYVCSTPPRSLAAVLRIVLVGVGAWFVVLCACMIILHDVPRSCFYTEAARLQQILEWRSLGAEFLDLWREALPVRIGENRRDVCLAVVGSLNHYMDDFVMTVTNVLSATDLYTRNRMTTIAFVPPKRMSKTATDEWKWDVAREELGRHADIKDYPYDSENDQERHLDRLGMYRTFAKDVVVAAKPFVWLEAVGTCAALNYTTTVVVEAGSVAAHDWVLNILNPIMEEVDGRYWKSVALHEFDARERINFGFGNFPFLVFVVATCVGVAWWLGNTAWAGCAGGASGVQREDGGEAGRRRPTGRTVPRPAVGVCEGYRGRWVFAIWAAVQLGATLVVINACLLMPFIYDEGSLSHVGARRVAENAYETYDGSRWAAAVAYPNMHAFERSKRLEDAGSARFASSPHAFQFFGSLDSNGDRLSSRFPSHAPVLHSSAIKWLLICALVLLTYAAYAQGTHPNVTVPRMLVSAASLAASMWLLLWLL